MDESQGHSASNETKDTRSPEVESGMPANETEPEEMQDNQNPEVETDTSTDETAQRCADEASEKDHVAPAPVTETTPKKKLSKKYIVGITIAIAITAIAIIGGVFYSNQQSEIERYNNYVDALNFATVTMASGGSEAEDACNTIVNVWKSAIYYDSSDEWDADIRPYYSDDFNEALDKLFDDQTFTKSIEEIESNQDLVGLYMKDLQNPPKGCERAYEEVKHLYSSYITFTKLATSPTGSYNSYSDDFHEYNSQFDSGLRIVLASIPDKKE